MSELESIKEQLAAVLGETPESLKQKEPQWLRYMRQGVILTLHISRWRARSKLTFADLGIPEPQDAEEREAVENLLSLGRKNLLPLEYIREWDAIDSGARKFLAENSYSTYWGAFVTAAKYPDVKAKLQEFQERYMEVMSRLERNWEPVRTEMRDNYRHQAAIAYRRLSALAPLSISITEDHFVSNFVHRVVNEIPSFITVKESVSLTWEIAFVPLPSLLAEDELEAEKLRAMTDQTREEEDRRIKNQYEVDRIQLGKEREMASLEVQMHREVMENAREQKEQLINSFLRDLVVTLRSQIYHTSAEVLDSIQRNQRVHPRSVIQLQNLIENIQGLNFFQDRDVDGMINQLRAVIAQTPEIRDRNLSSITDTLAAIGTVTRATLLDLGESPRSGRSVGIEDIPTVESLRAARAKIDIVAPEMDVKARQGRLNIEAAPVPVQ